MVRAILLHAYPDKNPPLTGEETDRSRAERF